MHLVGEEGYPGFTLDELVDMYRRRVIALPDWQRSQVWKDAAKSAFMDSVFSSYMIAPIFLYRNAEGQLWILDGQQRITTLEAFVGGNVRLPKVSNERYTVEGFTNREYRSFQEIRDRAELRPAYDFFMRRKVTVFIFEGTPAEMMHQYYLLNLGESLKPAEMYKAMNSYVVHRVIEIIRTHRFFTHNMKLSNVRHEHIDYLLRFILLSMNRSLVALGRKELDHLVTTHTIQSDEIDHAIQEVVAILNSLSQIFTSKDRLLSKSTMVPMIYWLCHERRPDMQTLKLFLIDFDEVLKHNSKAKKAASILLEEYNRSTRDATARFETIYNRYQAVERLHDKYLDGGIIDLNIETDDILPMKTPY